MTKAVFSEQQPSVKQTGAYIQICLNEKTVKEKNEAMDGQEPTETTFFEYDFHEFIDATVDIEAIKAHPEEYLDYHPKPEPVTSAEKKQSIEEQLASIKKNQEMMEQAVQDLTLMMMGE